LPFVYKQTKKMVSVEVHQIYYDQASRMNCTWPLKYYNKTLTPFFENEVIVDLVKNKGITGDYFGIFSHKILRKTIFKQDKLILSPDSLEKTVNKYQADFFAFEKRRKNGHIIKDAERIHRGIATYTMRLLKPLGYRVPKTITNPVLLNHFVAKKEVYERYVDEMLMPVMRAMGWKEKGKWDRKVFPELHQNARYKKTPYNFRPYLGYNHYPYHPFILERLPSVWLEYNKDIKVKQIF